MATEWPELVGKSAEEAKAVILKEHPKFTIEILDEKAAVTTDTKADRVRIFKNAEGKVVSVPKVG